MLSISLPDLPGICNPKPANNRKARAAIALALGRHNVRAKITPQLIAELRPPVRGEAFVWDLETRGFGIRILPSGVRSWVTQVRINHRSIRRTIARCDRLPITLARERAREILAQAALGRDWFAERKAMDDRAREAEQAASADRSLGARLSEYLADPEVRMLRTFPTIERYLRKVWAPVHGMDAEIVTSRDITAQLERIAVGSGSVSANRARSILNRACAWLLDTHRLERDSNPCSRARRWKERGRRRRAPTLDELAAIWRAAGVVYPDTFGAIVRLLILTAARRNEIARLTKGEVDLDRAEITLPPARVKIDQPFWIPLSAPAVRVLRSLPERRGDRLFPVLGWARCKRALDDAAGVHDWTLHDLRRAFSSLARDRLQVDGDDVERALGHIPAGVRGRYDFSERKQQRRQLAEAWSRLILESAGEPVDQAPVLRVVGGGR
jgi:integrase